MKLSSPMNNKNNFKGNSNSDDENSETSENSVSSAVTPFSPRSHYIGNVKVLILFLNVNLFICKLVQFIFRITTISIINI